jgi:hypothetical protein
MYYHFIRYGGARTGFLRRIRGRHGPKELGKAGWAEREAVEVHKED